MEAGRTKKEEEERDREIHKKRGKSIIISTLPPATPNHMKY